MPGVTDNYAIPYPYGSEAPNTAGDMQRMAERVDEVLGSNVFTPWTPSWLQEGGAGLAIQNGRFDCRWLKVGSLIVATFAMYRGSTTNIGSAGYRWTLPVPARSADQIFGTGFARNIPVTVRGMSAQQFALITSSGAAQVSPSNPGSWASGDSIRAIIQYEAQ